MVSMYDLSVPWRMAERKSFSRTSQTCTMSVFTRSQGGQKSYLHCFWQVLLPQQNRIGCPMDQFCKAIYCFSFNNQIYISCVFSLKIFMQFNSSLFYIRTVVLYRGAFVNKPYLIWNGLLIPSHAAFREVVGNVIELER